MSRRSRRQRAEAKSRALAAPAALGVTPFDGANYSTSRPFLPWLDLNSRREVDVYARTELVRASRFCFNNSSVFKRLFGALAHMAVGSGLFPVPETSDEEWNILSMARHERWAGNKFLCDVHRRRTGFQMQRTSLLNMMKDGAQFAAKRKTAAGAPQVQLIDAMDVGCAGAEDEKDRLWDGIFPNDDDAADAYRVLGRNPGEYRDVPATDMLHIYNPERTLQYRELPWAYTGTNSGRDIIDIIAATKNGVKLDSLFGLVVKQEVQQPLSGSTRPGGGARPNQPGTTGTADPRLEQFSRAGILAYLRPGESIETVKSERGNATWRQFIYFLIADVAWSIGVSPDFLFCIAETGGVAANASMEDVAWFLIFLQDLIIESFCQPLYVWTTAIDLASGRLRKCKDPEWYKCGWTRPARITANQSKTATSDIALYNAGMLPLDDYAARFGTSARAITDKLVREELYRKRVCALHGLDTARIRPPLPGSPAPLLLTNGEKEEDDEPSPAKK